MALHTGVITNRAGITAARWIFTDRHSGFSAAPYDQANLATHVGDMPLAVAANRARVAALLDIPTDRMIWPGLVHSTDVGVIEEPIGVFPNVDILVTNKRKLALATMGADCVPLLAVDPEAGVALSAHIGWKGAADGIVDAICDAIVSSGGALKHTHMVLGPSICGACYSVEPARQAAVVAVLPQAHATTSDGQPSLDLGHGLSQAFSAAGARVQRVGDCTAESTDLFSHRREGITGRQGGAIVLTSK